MSKTAADGQVERPFVERRRPGRIEDVSPHLIPLLRGEVSVEDQIDPEMERRTNKKLVSTERTITVVLLLTVGLWASIFLGGWSWLIEAPAEPPHAGASIPDTGVTNPAKAFTASPY